ncbi:class I SAM-dependent methyltransferase [Microbacterium sp.]|uniref:class I SAM-dependent methyltransferase n=1 Tax=Microbacterium sp. TaxID=51671 RepID=UPI0028126575|nr:class I SAM-dependent methyltransferase [Microbacterium sp.]
MSDQRATSFGAQASAYDAGRPEYPVEAVEWMLARLPIGARRIADVGAGTGKLTRAVLATGLDEIVAVDPDARMLAALAGTTSAVPTVVGTAESLPLEDGSVDAVVMGQAWHWVDPVAASTEIGRVVRPAGTLGLIWNIRDEREEWVRALTGIMHSSPAENMVNGPTGPGIREPFDDVERRSWQWARPMSRAQLHTMVFSRSYLITAPERERIQIARDMDALFDELALDDAGTIDLPYVTTAYRATRRD